MGEVGIAIAPHRSKTAKHSHVLAPYMPRKVEIPQWSRALALNVESPNDPILSSPAEIKWKNGQKRRTEEFHGWRRSFLLFSWAIKPSTRLSTEDLLSASSSVILPTETHLRLMAPPTYQTCVDRHCCQPHFCRTCREPRERVWSQLTLLSPGRIGPDLALGSKSAQRYIKHR